MAVNTGDDRATLERLADNIKSQVPVELVATGVYASLLE
jgi:hypothetical protein